MFSLTLFGRLKIIEIRDGISYNLFFFFKQKTAYEIMPSLVGSEMCIRDRVVRSALPTVDVRDRSVAVTTGIPGLTLLLNSASRFTPAVSYTHLRAHETRHDLVCRLLLEKKKK